MILRDYQTKAVADVAAGWARHRAQCLVAPTGAGKTVLAQACMAGYAHVLFIAHRRELIRQAATRFKAAMIAPGAPYEPSAPVQVASIQTLLARELRPQADLVILDEAHHYRASDWGPVLDAYPQARILGLTATPQRSDGRPLGDLFTALVQAGAYSSLIRDGYLVPCRVFQPAEGMGQGELALHPLKAYQQYAAGTRCFAFASRVQACEELCAEFLAAGIPSAVVEAGTCIRDRDDALLRFSRGELRVLWNVQALTEGVDIPSAETVLLARKVGHQGLYTQIAGRILRTSPGKTFGTFIDLTGSTLQHGLPDADRIYSLDGVGMRPSAALKLTVCGQCGHTYESYRGACPECGFVRPRPEWPGLTFYNQALREVYRGADTEPGHKAAELARLRMVAGERGYGLGWAFREYAKLFGDKPAATMDDKRSEHARLLAVAGQRGYKLGWVAHQYRDTFGVWPRGVS